jgi:hypothetical protein
MSKLQMRQKQHKADKMKEATQAFSGAELNPATPPGPGTPAGFPGDNQPPGQPPDPGGVPQ